MLKDNTPQGSFVGHQAPTDQAAVPARSQQQHTTFGFGGPPGLPYRDSTPSTTFHPMYSEPLQRQPTPARLSGQSSHRGSSMSSTPAHGELSRAFSQGRVS